MIAVINPVLLDGGVHLLMLGVYRFQFYFQLAYGLGGGGNLLVKLLPLQCLELGL